MNLLLDTNVVSEPVRPRPHLDVMRWLAGLDEDSLFISVITLAELRHGVQRLAAGARKRQLDSWLRADLPNRFAGRILPVDARVADAYGNLVATRDAAGRPISTTDAFIAATALVYDLAVVTRDDGDFHGSVGHVINPWIIK